MDRGTLPSVLIVRGFDHFTRPGPTQITAPRRLAQRGSSLVVDLCISAAKHGTHAALHPHLTIFHILTGLNDEIRCFHCGGGFKGWQHRRSVERAWRMVPELCIYPLYSARERATV